MLLKAPASPFSLAGFNPATTRLEVWTSVDQWPVPNKQRAVTIKQGAKPQLDLVDQLLFFADTWFPVGAAFTVGDASLPIAGQAAQVRVPDLQDPNVVPTGKSLIRIGNQVVLVESVNYQDVEPQLKVLQQAAVPAARPKAVLEVAQGRKLPPPSPKHLDQPMRLASGDYVPRGLVLDYVNPLSGTVGAFTFSNGWTYVISNSFTVGSSDAIVTWQNNTCIKYASNAYLLVISPYISYPGTGAPAIFTSADDNEFGATVANSLGLPNYAASQALLLYYIDNGATIQNMAFYWAQKALEIDADVNGAYSYYLNNAAINNSSTSIYLNLQSGALYLSGDTVCNAPTSVSGSGYYYGSLTTSCGTPSPSFTASPTSGLAPLTVQFTDTSTGIIKAWDWNFGDGSAHSSYQDPSHSYTQHGTYSVVITVTGGDGVQYHATNTITVDGADFTYGPITGQAPLTVNFTNTSTGATSYFWTFGDTGTSSSPNPSHTFAFGTYTVTLTVQTGAGQSSKSVTLYVAPSTINNVSQMSGYQAEPTIAINPANTNIVVVFSPTFVGGGGICEAISHNGGSAFTNVIIAATNNANGYPYAGYSDVCAVFDTFGNLFLSYLTANSGGTTPTNIAVLCSANNGSTFSVVSTNFATQFSGGVIDQPWIAVGPSGTSAPYSLWLCYADVVNGSSYAIMTSGLGITNLGSIGTFSAPQGIPGTGSAFHDQQRIAVGPSGQVMCVFQDDTGGMYYSVNLTGLGSTTFSTATLIASSHVTWTYSIPPAANRTIDTGLGLAWDRSGFTSKRVYLVYTEAVSAGSQDSDIYVRYSDNNGTNWTVANGGLKVDDETNGTSQFWPAIAIDETSGKVAVSWYDARNDLTHDMRVQYFGAVSANAGANFSVNRELTPGQSESNPSANLLPWNKDYLDYTACAYNGGTFYAAWSDNSNLRGTNPDGTVKLDVYVTTTPW